MPTSLHRIGRQLKRKGLLPKLVVALRHYDRHKAAADLTAGVTVGVVALPLAMAFAISSGLTPQSGIYTAIVAGAIVSLFGGSRVQIGGPTGAFVVIVAGIVAVHGVDGLFMCTMMAGVILVALGVTGMGTAVRFIPRPVVVGFTNGIAVLIASTQIRDLFGLHLDRVPGEFVPRLVALAGSAGTWSPAATALAIGTLAVIVVMNRVSPRVPGSIVALCLGTAAVAMFRLGVDTIGLRFGGIPRGLPPMHIPTFRPELIGGLLMPAVTVAMLGAIESLMSAMVADRMSGDRHFSNVELVAQGLANIASPVFGGLPATGAIARTATNIRSGAQTPLAGVVHSLTLLLILLVAAPLAKNIPLSVLAAVLMVVAYNMGEWGEIPQLLRLTKTDIAVWIVTFGLTVFADLTVAVGVGMVLAALLFIHRVADTTTVTAVTDDYVRDGHAHILQNKTIPSYVRIYRIHGPFLFGATEKLRPVLDDVERLPEIVVLRLRNMTALDATGLKAFEDLAAALHASGRHLVLCGARHQPAQLIARADFRRHVGNDNICAHVEAALQRALERSTRNTRPSRKAMPINDAHCHFFSSQFFEPLGGARAIEKLGWEAPGPAEQLADRWAAELDRHHVARAALIASVPGDGESVAIAVRRHPARFVGFFMVDPTAPEVADAAAAAIDRGGLRAMCLFPAMHRYPLQDERVRRIFEVAAARPGTAVFVHCGVLSVGVRRKLGLPSPFDIRFGNPLDLHAIAVSFPTVPIIVPHFGAGLLREALMVADLCPNILLDTSSSNGWMKYQPGLTLPAVFKAALAVLGPDRLLFGTDSSFFPRGWVADVYERQSEALHEIGAEAAVRDRIFGGNFDRLFP